jgi:hypothetical protein
LQTTQEIKRTCQTDRGRDILNYSGDVATSTAYITTFKILINTTLSTDDAAMMMLDIKKYYIGNPLPRFEYIKMLLSRFLDEIVQQYNLKALAVDSWVYIEIRKGMYRLKQSGLLAKKLIQTRLTPFRYYPVLNYSHSHNPRCAPARTHGQIQAPIEPPN